MAITTNALDGLLYIRNGNITARWNFPDAVGSSITSPSGIGNPVSVTYGFLSAAPSYISVIGFLAFDSAQQQATRDVLASIQEIANIDFTEAGGGVSQMTFAMSTQSLGEAGYAYTPGYSYSYSGSTITSVSEQSVSGDVWLNGYANWDVNAWQPGYDGYVTLLHEIGHALGLKHPFESSTNGFILADYLDDESHTVMSYTMAPHSRVIEVSGTSTSYSWQETFIRPSTLMPLDIEALQYLYGANTSIRAGNDVYQWSQSAELLETIWDGGGIDTIDCSNQIFTCIIDLRAGAYSSIALRQTDAEIRLGLELPSWFTQVLPADIYNGSANLAIAAKVVIEKAIGGAGNDQITGNSANNSLLGGGGVDRLAGNGGDDTLNGGTGVDSMTGGTGDDTYVVDNAGDIVTELSGQGVDLVQSDITYTLTANVEKLTLIGTTAINGTGNTLNNTLTGNSAANVLNGGAGNDTLLGGVGNDTYLVAQAGDVITELAGAGIDTVKSSITWTLGDNVEKLTLTGTNAVNGTGNALNNTLTGNAAANQLQGSAGADTLLGGGGNDTLDGGTGIDTMKGGVGDDLYVVEVAGDIITEAINAGIDTVQSSVTRVLGANQENLVLTGATAINGTGNTLNNSLTGNAANNVLNGGTGNDALTGGLGRDSFVFNTALNAGTNVDTLTDFTTGMDKIRLDDNFFTALTGQIRLTADQLCMADGITAAQDAFDRIIYDTAAGTLYYDTDGVGGMAAVQFASLDAQPALFASDFLVIA